MAEYPPEFDLFFDSVSAYWPSVRDYVERLGFEWIYLSYAYRSQCRFSWSRAGDRILLRDLQIGSEPEVTPELTRSYSAFDGLSDFVTLPS